MGIPHIQISAAYKRMWGIALWTTSCIKKCQRISRGRVRTLVWPELWPSGPKWLQQSQHGEMMHPSFRASESTEAWHLGPTCGGTSRLMMYCSSTDNKKNGRHWALHHVEALSAFNEPQQRSARQFTCKRSAAESAHFSTPKHRWFDQWAVDKWWCWIDCGSSEAPTLYSVVVYITVQTGTTPRVTQHFQTSYELVIDYCYSYFLGDFVGLVQNSN